QAYRTFRVADLALRLRVVLAIRLMSRCRNGNRHDQERAAMEQILHLDWEGLSTSLFRSTVFLVEHVETVIETCGC
ncbi:hypothetical protein PMAYCL1PPCAC_19650, partial [Pristionchus mayeri]